MVKRPTDQSPKRSDWPENRFTRIAACLRSEQTYRLLDVDGTPISETEGRVIVAERYSIPTATPAARGVSATTGRQPRRNERAKKGVAERPETPLVPVPA